MKEYSFGICPYILRKDGFYILLNKTSRVSDWNFFKGKMEAGELITQCALREFEEETGRKLRTSRLEEYFYQTSKRKDIGVYLVNFTNFNNDLSSFKFQEKEIHHADWVKLDSEFVMSKNQSKIILDIKAFFKS